MTAMADNGATRRRAVLRRGLATTAVLVLCGGCAGSERTADGLSGREPPTATTRSITVLDPPVSQVGAPGTAPPDPAAPSPPDTTDTTTSSVEDGTGPTTTTPPVTATTGSTPSPTIEPVHLPGFPPPLLPARPGPLVVMVGDSLMWSATSELHDRFIASGAGETRIAAVAGSRLDDMVDLVGAGARADADVLVVALGTNDLRRGPGDLRDDDTVLADANASVGRVVGAARGARCVVWVTVGASTGFAGLGDRPDRFAASLPVALAPLGATVRVADWRAASAGHPDWFDWDGLHLSRSGQVAFAGVIADQASTCPTL